jgi:hypothetical protein
MDIVGLLTRTSERNEYLLTFQDELSKCTMAIPIQQQDTKNVTRVFVEQIILNLEYRRYYLLIKVLIPIAIYSITYANC